MKKDDGNHVHITSADISADSLSGMVIFRPHYLSRGTTSSGLGPWYALRPSEVRGFARALLDAADNADLRAKTLLAERNASEAPRS